MQNIDNPHPLYSQYLADWLQMRHTYGGERFVKEQGFTYLPATSGMAAAGLFLDGTTGSRVPGSVSLVNVSSPGWRAYDAYRLRARFPDWVRDAVRSLLGVMHRKPATIELPAKLQPLIERASGRGETLQMLLQRVTEEQLITGRVGVLGDVVDTGTRVGEPYLAVYPAETVVNWDESNGTNGADLQSLNLVVLDESEPERKGFTWENVQKHRVLVLGDPLKNEAEGDGATYRVGVFRETLAFNEAELVTPGPQGRAASEIPFVFINTADVSPTPDRPPLLGLSNLALTYYRGQADYRQSLFMQGQDTLVLIGSTYNADQSVPVGAGARIDLPVGSEAKYIGVSSTGLPEQRSALENDAREAQQLSGQLLDANSRQRESGDALRTRLAARAATIVEVALSAAYGLQELLRKMARWFGDSDAAVRVLPNLDFTDQTLSGEELSKLMAAKTMGAPLSLESLHALMLARGLTTQTFEEELKRIEEDRERMPEPPGSTNPNGPEADPQDDPQSDPQDDPADSPSDA